MSKDPLAHVHGCLKCRPDMVPKFDYNDIRYHTKEKCKTTLTVYLDGKETGYTKSVFEGKDGWILQATETKDVDELHACPNCSTHIYYHMEEGRKILLGDYIVCVEPKFGEVKVVHEVGY